ncbi:type IV secretory system conjugative DNA transfer family protein [Desulfonatronum thioautotrophicum]|uniref:type IV secretory system conjugative DNA transfer family protein n=1 Tax=Desulfonatronum thioautotrophicum TaxID=617001 RepID=UPI0005EBB147|nr:type IV secretory system conjugative DNA transfer family protein [Desulfonatronum thioautotrophicum]
MNTTQVMTAFRNHDIGALRKRIVASTNVDHHEYTTLFTFDSKTTLSMEEGKLNVLIVGATGRGKTRSLVTPISERLIKMGLGGLIIDVKNTQCDNIRKIAASCGRLDDIVEVGSFATARPVNLLAGIEEQELRDMLENMMITGIQNSNNLDWHYKGVSIVLDCLRLLQYLDEAEPGGLFSPTLSLLAKMTYDFEFARNLWQHWILTVSEPTREQAAFRAFVESNSFHVLCKDESGSGSFEWERQVTWQLANVRRILNDFSRSELSRKLSDSRGLALDLDELILKKKNIVILRFSPRTGGPGRIVARHLKERFYQSVYSRYEHPCTEHRPVFCILDEFQDVLNLDENSSLDDFNWFSKAREFNVINVAATQSMSSLYRNGLHHKVNAMLCNFGTKILMQCDDPATDGWTRTFFEAPKPVQKLCKGEVILAKYAFPKRQLEVSVESVQQAHDRMVSILSSMTMPEVTPFSNDMNQAQLIQKRIWKPDWVINQPALMKLYTRFDMYLRDAKIVVHSDDPEKLQRIIEVMEMLLEQLQKSGIALKHLEWPRRGRYVIKTQSRQKEAAEMARALFRRICETCGTFCGTELIRHDLKKRCAECEIDMLRDRLDEHLILFFETYQRNLQTPFAGFSFPEGWSRIVECAMAEMLHISETILISSIYVKDGFLNISVCKSSIPSKMEKSIMDIILQAGESCKITCRICGNSPIDLQNRKLLCVVCASKDKCIVNEVE